jgi:hypothetical protein
MNFLKKYISLYSILQKRKKFINIINALEHPKFEINTNQTHANFSHTGLIGDVIYAIPCMYALSKNKKINLLLDITHKTTYTKKAKHYNTDTMLNERSVNFLKPLILAQSKFDSCEILNHHKIDYDLNEFRKYPFDYRMGNICRWYFLTFATNYDLSKAWLKVNPNLKFKDSILVARSFRYRTPLINYSILRNYTNVFFVGLEDEFDDMKKNIPNIIHQKVNDALELAEIIAGCKFFIGNQSFPFAVAEALKVKRVLEVSFENPNVIVDGENGYDFCYQPQFEKIIKELIENDKKNN